MSDQRYRLLYEFAPYPPNARIMDALTQGAENLLAKLNTLSVEDLPISAYNKRYLRHILANLTGNMKRSVYLLAWALTNARGGLERAAVLEHGGGTGLLTLLAKQAGVGTVVYNDIYDVSCRDAAEIGRRLSCEADRYIHGDIEVVIRESHRLGLELDGIVSYDCIEHIYDIDAFLESLQNVPGSLLSISMGSSANPFWTENVRRIEKFQRQVEYLGREQTTGQKDRDSIRAYRSLRSEIIKAYASNLADHVVEELVSRTRGLIRADIEASVVRYLQDAELPSPPQHPTNTCDPLTGNWAEHLMNPYELTQRLSGAGFASGVRPGFLNTAGKSRAKRVRRKFWNLVSRMAPRIGLRFAPYYVLHGSRRHGGHVDKAVERAA